MKYLSLLLFSLIFHNNIIAQDYKFETGIQGGPNVSFYKFNNTTLKENTKPYLGYTASLYFQYNINKTLSVKIQPGIESKGFKYTSTTPNSVNDRDPEYKGYTFTYMTIPFLLKASFGKKATFFINAGPYVGILISEKLLYSEYGSTDTKKLPTMHTDGMGVAKSKDFGITTGLGIAIPIKKCFSLSFELRNNIGLVDINKYSATSKTYARNASLLIGFAYKFGSKK